MNTQVNKYSDIDSNRKNNFQGNKNIYVNRIKPVNPVTNNLMTNNHNNAYMINSNITSLNSISYKDNLVNHNNLNSLKIEREKINNNSIETHNMTEEPLNNYTTVTNPQEIPKNNYPVIQKIQRNNSNAVVSNNNLQNNKINNSNTRASSSHINRLKIENNPGNIHQSQVNININQPIRVNSQIKPKTAYSRQISNPIVKINNISSNIRTNITNTMDSQNTHLLTNEQPINSIDRERYSKNIQQNQHYNTSNTGNTIENKKTHMSSSNLTSNNRAHPQIPSKISVQNYGSNYQNYKSKLTKLNTKGNINYSNLNSVGVKSIISPSNKTEKEQPVIVKIKSSLIDNKQIASKGIGQVVENRYDIYSRPVTCKQPVQARIKQSNLYENKVLIPVNISNVYRSNSSAKPRVMKKIL